MISLTAKQIADLAYISNVQGGVPVDVEKVQVKRGGGYGYATYAYTGYSGKGRPRSWLLPPRARMKEVTAP